MAVVLVLFGAQPFWFGVDFETDNLWEEWVSQFLPEEGGAEVRI